MPRIHILLGNHAQTYRYLDSVHAALVAGLAESGLESQEIVGERARPWTFACSGHAQPGGMKVLKSIMISTPDDRVAEALAKLNLAAARRESSNGDVVDLTRGRIRRETRLPELTASEICINFASPFAVIRQKKSKEDRTYFSPTLVGINVPDALKHGLNRRAGRELDLEIAVDRLTLATEGTPRLVSLRRQNGNRIMVPSFSMPMTLRGNPDDIRWAYLAGLGVKTRQGFGCPIMQG